MPRILQSDDILMTDRDICPQFCPLKRFDLIFLRPFGSCLIHWDLICNS
jgi:hypothetical protein